MYEGSITDVEGLKLGHASDLAGMTGCTVILAEDGAVGGVDVRGAAPGTRETDLFQERKTVDRVHGIVLSGGSAYGLDACGGVMKYLEERGIGLDTGHAKVPIVASAVIYDLGIGDSSVRPGFQMGYEACLNSSYDKSDQGSIGCGTGASVGKILGPEYSMKSGLGTASLTCKDLVVGAIVAVNALGDIYEFTSGEKIAGVYDYPNEKFLDTVDIMKSGYGSDMAGKNTTIGLVGSNAILGKAEANKLAEMAHNAYARSINPVHTGFDGDTIFSLATGKVEADVNLVGVLAIEAMAKAISNAILSADSYKSILAHKDIKL